MYTVSSVMCVGETECQYDQDIEDWAACGALTVRSGIDTASFGSSCACVLLQFNGRRAAIEVDDYHELMSHGRYNGDGVISSAAEVLFLIA
jgi:hypothetical protein